MSLHFSTQFKYTLFRISLELLLTISVFNVSPDHKPWENSRDVLWPSHIHSPISPLFQKLGKINLVFFVLKCVSGWQVIFQDTLQSSRWKHFQHTCIKTSHRLTKWQNKTEENSVWESFLKTIHTANKQTNKQTKDWAQNFRHAQIWMKKVSAQKKKLFSCDLLVFKKAVHSNRFITLHIAVPQCKMCTPLVLLELEFFFSSRTGHLLKNILRKFHVYSNQALPYFAWSVISQLVCLQPVGNFNYVISVSLYYLFQGF